MDSPETTGDDAAFARAIRRLAATSDEEFAQIEQRSTIPVSVPPLPENPTTDDRLDQFAAAFMAFLVDHARKHPCPFPGFTPQVAREYVAKGLV
jgi:hypothetical protein